MELKDVLGFEGIYKVSKDGRIFCTKCSKYNNRKDEFINGMLELKQSVMANGYMRVTLCGKSMKVHRIVLSSFLGYDCPNLHVDHIDCNKQNNNLNNLEFVTCKENLKRAYDNGLSHKRQTKVRKDRKLSDDVVKMVKFLLSKKLSNDTIKYITGINSKDLYAIRKGRNYNAVKLDDTEISI